MILFTPQTLAFILDMEETKVRDWLRHYYPDKAPGKGGRWLITPTMARRVARTLRAERSERAAA